MLGKLNMGGCHCNNCTCLANKFREENKCDIQIVTQTDLVKIARGKLQRTQDLNVGLKVCKYDGLQGIKNTTFARILVRRQDTKGARNMSMRAA